MSKGFISVMKAKTKIVRLTKNTKREAKNTEHTQEVSTAKPCVSSEMFTSCSPFTIRLPSPTKHASLGKIVINKFSQIEGQINIQSNTPIMKLHRELVVNNIEPKVKKTEYNKVTPKCPPSCSSPMSSPGLEATFSSNSTCPIPNDPQILTPVETINLINEPETEFRNTEFILPINIIESKKKKPEFNKVIPQNTRRYSVFTSKSSRPDSDSLLSPRPLPRPFNNKISVEKNISTASPHIISQMETVGIETDAEPKENDSKTKSEGTKFERVEYQKVVPRHIPIYSCSTSKSPDLNPNSSWPPCRSSSLSCAEQACVIPQVINHKEAMDLKVKMNTEEKQTGFVPTETNIEHSRERIEYLKVVAKHETSCSCPISNTDCNGVLAPCMQCSSCPLPCSDYNEEDSIKKLLNAIVPHILSQLETKNRTDTITTQVQEKGDLCTESNSVRTEYQKVIPKYRHSCSCPTSKHFCSSSNVSCSVCPSCPQPSNKYYSEHIPDINLVDIGAVEVKRFEITSPQNTLESTEEKAEYQKVMAKDQLNCPLVTKYSDLNSTWSSCPNYNEKIETEINASEPKPQLKKIDTKLVDTNVDASVERSRYQELVVDHQPACACSASKISPNSSYPPCQLCPTCQLPCPYCTEHASVEKMVDIILPQIVGQMKVIDLVGKFKTIVKKNTEIHIETEVEKTKYNKVIPRIQ